MRTPSQPPVVEAHLTTAKRLARAAVIVVSRDGFDALSVRSVAMEARVAPGTVQHHYRTRAELLLAAFDETVATISARLALVDLDGPIGSQLSRLLRQALPLDPERRQECIVWVALTAAATSHPELVDTYQQAVSLLRDSLRALISSARDAGEVAASVDPVVAAGILSAVVDGLTFQGLAAGSSVDGLTETLDSTIRHVLRA